MCHNVVNFTLFCIFSPVALGIAIRSRQYSCYRSAGLFTVIDAIWAGTAAIRRQDISQNSSLGVSFFYQDVNDGVFGCEIEKPFIHLAHNVSVFIHAGGGESHFKSKLKRLDYLQMHPILL